MRELKWVVGAVVLFAALGPGRAADDHTFDLRGPGPQKGQEFVSTTTLKVKDADTVLKMTGEALKLKLTLLITLEEEGTLLEVSGRDVTKYQTKILKDRVDTSSSDKGVSHSEPSALERETVVSTRGDKKWQHVLVDNRPTEKQQKLLDERNGIETDDGLYPKEKVKVGHTWTSDAVGINRALGTALSDVKGKLDQKFVKVEQLDGEKVAVVESSGRITGKMKDNGEPTLTAEIDLKKQTTWKSLKTGVVVREEFEGTIKLDGTMRDGGIKIEMTLSGPISGGSTTKLVDKKK